MDKVSRNTVASENSKLDEVSIKTGDINNFSVGKVQHPGSSIPVKKALSFQKSPQITSFGELSPLQGKLKSVKKRYNSFAKTFNFVLNPIEENYSGS